MDLATLDTPSLILDRQRLEANLDRMAARADALGVRLRPHMKTAKSADVARLAAARGAAGIAVSTLREAAYFAAHGWHDIQYAVCVDPHKLAWAAELRRRGCALTLVIDSREMVAPLADTARRHGVGFDVLIEIDSGEARTGLAADVPELARCARELAEAQDLRLAGVMTHAGHSYRGRSIEAIAAIAEHERAVAKHAAGVVRETAGACETISVGSTPTALHAASAEGVTELRAGIYMLGDLFQSEIGSCRVDDIAASVLTTVIGRRPEAGRMVVDAGALALSKDRSTAAAPNDYGYGLVCDIRGQPLEGRPIVAGVHQEHGEIDCQPELARQLAIGSRLRILPNHGDTTAAMYEHFQVVEGADTRVIDRWARANGWTVSL